MRRLEDQPGLADYLSALWKRKWLIMAATIGLMVIVAIISLLTPPVWESDMIIQPAKFLNQTQAGQFIDVLMVDPRQLATAVNQRAYHHQIAKDLNVEPQNLPILLAEFLKDTRLVKVIARSKKPDKAVAVLQKLFLHLQEDLDKKIHIEVDTIDTDIKKNELHIDFLGKEIGILDNKLKILEQREREMLAEKKAASERISRLEKEQGEALRTGTGDVLGQLVYSNVIQQNYQYINSLDDTISDKKIKSEDYVRQKRENEQSINILSNSIKNLVEQKGKYEYTLMIKEPTPPVFPVSPKKKQNVLLAGVLGVMIFSLVALVQDSLQKEKAGEK